MNIFTIIITQPLANGIIFFYHLLGDNLGLAIIVFSIALRFALTPLTKPYMESMKKMKEYQPDLEKLKKRHAGDRVKLAQAQADFYKEKGINPSSGCLPYILQIVVLIALFRLFINVLSPDVDTVMKFNELLYEPLKFAASETINLNFLWMNLSQPDTFNVEGFPFALPGITLFLAAALQFLSAKISQPFVEQKQVAAKATPEKGDDFTTAIQSSMVYTFPLMTLVIGLNFPSGLALYWLVFSAYQGFQQYKTSGWGGLTPWVKKFGILTEKEIKSANKKKSSK